MALRVIGAGFGRTGTMSLKHALERLLGGRCYHMVEVIENAHSEFWARKARGERAEFEEVLEDYVATVDWPTTRYYAELAQRYPEAKIVLTVRDPERWYESTRTTIRKLTRMMQRPPVRWMIQSVGKMRAFPGMTDDVVWGPRGEFGGRFEDRDHAIAVYEAHNAEVERSIPADRLLVYELKQGWGPLCEFLGVPVPDGPMPHANDAAVMQRRIRWMYAAGWATAPVTFPLSLLRR